MRNGRIGRVFCNTTRPNNTICFGTGYILLDFVQYISDVIFNQVLMPVVGVVGVIGNLGAILILMRPEMKSTFHHSLITLAIVDIIFVITLIVDTQVWGNLI